MVLHNSKWDKRAKGKYLKKHGLTAKDVDKSKSQNSTQETDHAGTQEVSPGDTLEGSQVWSQTDSQDGSFGPQSETQVVATGIDLPELEVDEDEEALIKAHIARQREQFLEAQKTIPTASSTDNSIFAQAEAGYERSKLNERVRNHIGRQAKHVDVDSDSDFEQFMDELSDSETAPELPLPASSASIEVNSKQRDLLDKLLQ